MSLDVHECYGYLEILYAALSIGEAGLWGDETHSIIAVLSRQNKSAVPL
jgi:hypothetical protein